MKPAVVVTGASKGIGLEVTRILLQKFNANVIAISRTRTPELIQLGSDSLVIVESDVADEKALSNAISLGASRYHGIDALILNAGTLDPLCRIGDDTPLDSWKRHFDVNFFSLVTAVRAALPYLRKSVLGGRVVFVSSGAAVKGMPGWGPYNAGTYPFHSLSLLASEIPRGFRTLAEEEPDIACVAVRPGMVDTGMQDTLRAFGGSYMNEKDHQIFLKVHEDGKLVKPQDCGHVIAALSLQAPKSLSGQFVSWDSEECKPFRKE
ncbi:putative oxidoreductase C30D10.05c [Psilocybe cubensis]|uniref:Oxidoreductase C30D10.05c n=2 Tax=Psilocybe cubensis TaxID=181762 RepID=A0ACB8H6A9_PSICU|nr:putative oxidoreductase C30D10.05c [Psilocybe cubensis]KAH9482720.1 putative oxidoreductase C30D10.05c [Psilocybe cubensis]